MTARLTEALLLAGSAFMLSGALGLLRFPDFYTRMQAPAKAGTLGKACLLLAVMLHFRETEVTVQALLIIVFFYATAPAAAHAIAQAAYLAGIPLWTESCIDELRSRPEGRRNPAGR